MNYNKFYCLQQTIFYCIGPYAPLYFSATLMLQNESDKSYVQEQESSSKFKFGDGVLQTSF